MRRKHRVVVEITTERELTAKEAREAVQAIIDGYLDEYGPTPFLVDFGRVVRLEAKEFGRVAKGLQRGKR